MKKNTFLKRHLTFTKDGSSSLKLNCFDEYFHSVHGAIGESMHVYIHAGLEALSQQQISVFEMGFGTGLNALLTLVYGKNKQIDYQTIEIFPLVEREYLSLNYVDLVCTQAVSSFSKEKLHNSFLTMHQSKSGETIQISPNFRFTKEIIHLEEKIFEPQSFDIVYFDAFSPETQPELWNDQVFEKLCAAMRKGGVLTTYCAKGTVKRSLKRAGFTIENLPGPTGKREITRAFF